MVVVIKMENGKALHSGKNAEKRRLEALRKELLVLVHDFLTEEGLFEAADLLKDHLSPLLQQYKIADNIDLPLIATDFLAYYRLRFHKDPVLVKRCENVNETPVNKNQRNRFVNLLKRGFKVTFLILQTFIESKKESIKRRWRRKH